MATNTNPFEAFTKFMPQNFNQNPFADAFKGFSEFKAPSMPNMDMAGVMNSGRRNMEAVTEAGQAVVESAQAISRRQAELARQHVEKMLKSGKDMLVNGSPEINTTKQIELARTVMETSLNNLREVSEMVTKSGLELFDVFNRRVAEQLEELTAHNAPASKKKAA